MIQFVIKINKWIFKTIFFVLFAALFSITLLSCSDKSKKAKDYLKIAESDYLAGDYESAKSNIDSIKLLYPKAFKEIREGFDLMQDVRKAENKRNIIFIDSMIDANIIKLKELQRNFDFVRDENYQEFGNYIPKITPSLKTLEQNTLRSGVSEKGILFLESVLSGRNLNHNKIKVSIPDGSYAESLTVTADGLNYKFTTLKKTYEIVRFIGNDENGLSEFIYTFKDIPITLTYIGKKNYTKTLSKIEKDAISQSFELSNILYEIEELKYEKGKTEALLRYLDQRTLQQAQETRS
ncbi:MAG: hypothetical protein PHQ56_00695 [Dysgonamonadaceae bacterium]|jgi:hypothetical protein|nr:hypothetical protein [Dysgonamonadaceae bacterium]MDD3356612.1 hypothetical protein [Dysgonamonadaceae bacterium]MDD3726952.1 hypothetical protein [Dysgonamonadaceae bacterium]MDD4604872.1 hypothetical protein [Dysgonamonadaceae bacterium]HUI33307.1 hypothetical protein [Dysgonamonadaceae bacterium]